LGGYSLSCCVLCTPLVIIQPDRNLAIFVLFLVLCLVGKGMLLAALFLLSVFSCSFTGSAILAFVQPEADFVWVPAVAGGVQAAADWQQAGAAGSLAALAAI
jgi:hypothetical protein